IAGMALLWSVCASAQQYSISGRVQGAENKNPLSGATLELKELRRFVVSDEFGNYYFAKVPPGNYTIEVRFLGFNEKIETISLSSDIEVNFELEESLLMTDEVVVYATRAGDKTPTTYSSINKQVLQKQNF